MDDGGKREVLATHGPKVLLCIILSNTTLPLSSSVATYVTVMVQALQDDKAQRNRLLLQLENAEATE
jgi:hypothetical protein